MRFPTALLVLFCGLCSSNAVAQDDVKFVSIQTSMGDIAVELALEEAPATVENFLGYATSGYYDRLVFHRVVPGTLIQGGGFNRFYRPRATTQPPVRNEADNGLRNLRGTIAMARFDDPDSATSQFYINLKDNPDLDRTGDEFKYQAGYTVFGRVVAGMDIADQIGALPTGPGPDSSALGGDVPTTVVLIKRIDPISGDGFAVDGAASTANKE